MARWWRLLNSHPLMNDPKRQLVRCQFVQRVPRSEDPGMRVGQRGHALPQVVWDATHMMLGIC